MIIGILTAWCLTPVIVRGATPSADVRVTTRANADSVTVGEMFRIIHEAVYPDSFELALPEEIGVGNCRLLGLNWTESQRDGYTTKRATVEVLTTDLDAASVPRSAFLFVSPAGDTVTVYTDAVEVPVRHLTGETSETRPLKPQWEAPRSHLIWFVAAALIVIAAIAAYLLRRFRKREVKVAPRPALPADFVALQRIDEIERLNLPESGEFKRHYTLVVDVLRQYLENRYGVMAMDRTSDEILWDLARIRVEIEDLEPMLNEADLVKFAKHRPDIGVAKTLLETARTIVVRTAERPALIREGSG
ncbi:MAG: hypothetical protein JSW50_00535 [Candidatus Latescibacterota bacterium]|nr:MAG: hypothetical protein JSW50_00535 [Candidatus Latescibacterota bacterium]